MKGRTVEIADAVVEALNANRFSVAFTTARQFVPRADLSDLDSLKVVVVPRGVKSELLDRGGNKLKEHSIEIGVQQHVTDVNDADTVDPISYLVDEIQDYLCGSEVLGAGCVEVNSILADDSIFAKEHLTEHSVLTSVMVARFVE